MAIGYSRIHTLRTVNVYNNCVLSSSVRCLNLVLNMQKPWPSDGDAWKARGSKKSLGLILVSIGTGQRARQLALQLTDADFCILKLCKCYNWHVSELQSTFSTVDRLHWQAPSSCKYFLLLFYLIRHFTMYIKVRYKWEDTWAEIIL